MKPYKKIFFTSLIAIMVSVSTNLFAQSLLSEAASQGVSTVDWVNFARYASKNTAITTSPIAVFMGNSITDNWATIHEEFFTSHNYVGRGISGQVTAQMLSRFRPDVINLKPQIVVILAGINDIAYNGGYISEEHIRDNIVSMAQLSKINNIKVILCSILPAEKFGWRNETFNKEVNPSLTVQRVNALLKEYADSDDNCTYLDLWTPMATSDGAIQNKYSNDSVHPTLEGYLVMESLLQPIIEQLIVN